MRDEGGDTNRLNELIRRPTWIFWSGFSVVLALEPLCVVAHGVFIIEDVEHFWNVLLFSL